MTIKDIARESGCALGTVSRVLNNHPDVSEQTRKKVLDVVKKYGFVLNENAKQLKMQNRKTLAIIVKGTASILLNAILEQILKSIEVSPYSSSIIFIDEYDNEAKRAKKVYYEIKPVGIIFLGGSPDWYEEDFKDIQIPCVIISNQADNVRSENLSSVSTDDFTASRFCAEYLIKKGHKNIGVIGGDIQYSELSKRRYMGFLAAMGDFNITFDSDLSYATSKYSFEGGFNAMEILLKKNPDITAVFTMSDSMAMGAIRKLCDMGYSVPENISVTGFDGTPMSEYVCPRLTTIRQKIDELVSKGLDVLLNCIEKKMKCVHLLVPFEFIEGESVKTLNDLAL